MASETKCIKDKLRKMSKRQKGSLSKSGSKKYRQKEDGVMQDVWDLFIDCLAFDPDVKTPQIKAEEEVGGHRGRIDLILSIPGGMSVVIELKRLLDTEESIKSAIEQCADYLIMMRKPRKGVINLKGRRHGIVTDGKIWVFFVLRKYGKCHRAHRLLQFNIKDHPNLALAVFKRMRRSTQKSFWLVLDAIHRDMTERIFDQIMERSFKCRIKCLCNKAKTARKGKDVAIEDVNLIKKMYAGGRIAAEINGFSYRRSVENPLKVTKKKSARRR